MKQCSWNRGYWKRRNVSWISFSIIALIRKGSMVLKACKNIPNVRIRLYVKIESDAWRNVRVMPGHTDSQTDTLFHIHLMKNEWLEVQNMHLAKRVIKDGLEYATGKLSNWRHWNIYAREKIIDGALQSMQFEKKDWRCTRAYDWKISW